MKYAYVNNNIIDLWSHPKFNSERLSQLFFGDPVRIEKERAGFYFIRQADGYKGWADKRFFELIQYDDFRKYLNSNNSFINATKAPILDFKTLKPVAPFFLHYGTILRTVKYNDMYHRINFTGNKFLLNSKHIVSIKKNHKANGVKFVNESKKFLGVNYLWGGISPSGFNCSGLVRTVLSKFNIYIPRDTKDQIISGIKIDRDNVQTGDLLFFDRHVGFAIGSDKVIHSSLGGGGVRINSLHPDGTDYRRDLDKDFKAARRII